MGDGYTQYPNDYAKEIYQKFYSLSRSKSQIIIHRDNNLMYYGYIRKLDNNSQYIGFCILLNGVSFTEVNRLYPLFEAVVTDLVSKGEILQFNNKGEIISLVSSLSQKEREVEDTSKMISNLAANLKPFVRNLPPVSFDVSNTECKTYKCDDNPNELYEASHKYGYTSILKDKGYDSEALTSYRNTLKRVINEKTIIQDKYQYLDNQYKVLEKQKKQYKWVSVLAVVIIVCLIGLYFLNSNLTNTITGLQGDVRDLQEVVESKENHITLMRDTIIDYQAQIARKNTQIKKLNTDLDDRQKSLLSARDSLAEITNTLSSTQSSLRSTQSNLASVKSTIPILISKIEVANTTADGTIETDFGRTIYSYNTMYITPKITYTGLDAGKSITLRIKFYTPENILSTSGGKSEYSYEDEMRIYSGTNTKRILGWGGQKKGHWKKGTYRIEIWYKDVCLKSKSVTIN